MSSSAVAEYLRAQAELLNDIDPAAIERLADILYSAWSQDNAVLVCGNGGSASIATHMACDLSKQTLLPGRRPLRAISLADNMAVVSAWANDAGFSRVFAEQVATHGRPGDVLLVLSCSGESDNIVEAISAARDAGMKVAALVGFGGGAAEASADMTIHVRSRDYGAVESAFLVVEHCLTQVLRERASVAADTSASVEASAMRACPAVFVDRDGVINRNLPGGVLSWEDFEFLPGALEGLAHLSREGYRVVVVTNQANVGRGLVTRARLDEIHRRMQDEIIRAGGRVTAVYCCEHLPEDGCACRKPAPGLLLQAASALGINLRETFFIGDHESDVQAAVAAGAMPLLVRSGRRSDKLGDLAQRVASADDLGAAAGIVMAGAGEEPREADATAVSR